MYVEYHLTHFKDDSLLDLFLVAFVGGKKMALPESAVRTNTAKYEEINIPLSEPAPTEVGNQLIPIASLDDISRKAFGNCKNLNKIQSVVFETAYRTNEVRRKTPTNSAPHRIS